MNDYGYIKAQHQYDNQIPSRYNKEPILICNYCDEGIYEGESFFCVGNDIYCNSCVSMKVAEKMEEGI